MISNNYSKACSEILEILKYIPKEEYNKIPKEKIYFYNKNKDNNYNYKFNPEVPIDKQEILPETNAMIVVLFRDYFATDNQKIKLENILENNDKIIEKKKQEKYSSENIFATRKKVKYENEIEEKSLAKCTNQNIFKRFIQKVKNIFHIL